MRTPRERALEDALRELEKANEAVCAGRTQRTYHQMLEDGQGDDLLRLDEARSKARSLLSK